MKWENNMTYQEFLRKKAAKFFTELDYDALYFVNTGEVFIYPGGIECKVRHGEEMRKLYEKAKENINE